MHFNTLEDYLAFEASLRSFGQEPNAEMLAEKTRLEAAQNVNEDEYIFGTMAAHIVLERPLRPAPTLFAV